MTTRDSVAEQATAVTSQVTAAANKPESYWELSRRPLVSLVFIAPILLAYELGVLTLGVGQPRNAADIWLRQSLGALGFGQYVLLPLLTCGVLLGWHHAAADVGVMIPVVEIDLHEPYAALDEPAGHQDAVGV